MKDAFLIPNTFLILFLWFLSVALLYWIIKTAVANGVREANKSLTSSVRQIEMLLIELNIKAKKESR